MIDIDTDGIKMGIKQAIEEADMWEDFQVPVARMEELKKLILDKIFENTYS